MGVAVGSTGLEAVWRWPHDAIAQQIIVEIRLPRTLGAWLAGALLGFSWSGGARIVSQPLADPYLLGSASGAALGGALALLLAGGAPLGLLWLPRLGMTGMAFMGAAGAVFLALVLVEGSRRACASCWPGWWWGWCWAPGVHDGLELRYPEILQPMKAFRLGSTALVGWAACAVMAAAWLLCWPPPGVWRGRWMAWPWARPRPPVRACLWRRCAGAAGDAGEATGTAVAQTGLIAFVGLAAPHLVRSLVQGPHRTSVVLASAMGGALLLAADILARGLLAPQELPVGVVTAFAGGQLPAGADVPAQNADLA